MTKIDYIGLGFVSNDHLAVLPFIPMDTKVKMLSHKIIGGGPAGNATAGYATLGGSAAFIGTVGDDADGRMILDEFQREGVNTDFIKIRKNATSAIAYLWIEEKTGNRSCAWTREGLDELTADEINGNPAIVSLIQNAKILHLDGHNAAGAIAAAKIAKAAGVTIMYDAGTHRDGMEELLALADLIICSEEFILKLTGRSREQGVGNIEQGAGSKEQGVSHPLTTSPSHQEDQTELAVREVFEKYHPKVCGATMGVRGSMCFDGENLVKCPAFKVDKVVDTTGCGDLFHTGFALRYAELIDSPEPRAQSQLAISNEQLAIKARSPKPEQNSALCLPPSALDDGRASRPATAAEMEQGENCTLHIAHCTLDNNSALRTSPSALIQNSLLLACQQFGAAVSALKCRGISGRPPSCPTRQEVEDFLAMNSMLSKK